MEFDLNPFRPTRWEHDSSGLPLIWFTPTAALLAGNKSVYVHGSRGSGKTTLLRGICWEDLVNNPSLRLQKKLSDLPHIGVYIRLPDHVSGSMGNVDWAKIYPDSVSPNEESFRFFSLAVELTCGERALEAVHQLRLSGEIDCLASQEMSVVRDVVEEFETINDFVASTPRTFVDLARAFRTIVRLMNEASGRGYLKDLLPKLPPREPYEILGMLSERLSGSIRYASKSLKPAPGFKFCLDDCEVLSENQLLSVNTLVRKSRFPVSWVICSVGDAIEVGETFVPEQPLTDADRRVISLDERDKTEFFRLCQAVASMRTYFSLPKDERPQVDSSSLSSHFQLEEKLGRMGVNDLIHLMIQRSTNPYAKEIRLAADHLLNASAARSINVAFLQGGEEVPPYYQAYLLWHWTGRENAFTSNAGPKDLKRIDDHIGSLTSLGVQAWLRRKMVGAYLHMATRLRTKRLPLAGASVVTRLADGSIRDFLEIMAEIYDAYGRQRTQKVDDVVVLQRFVNPRSIIPIGVQSAGIYSASEVFFDGVGALTDASSTAMAKLIEALGKYTSRLQTSLDDPSTLATTERGVFVFQGSEYLFADDDIATNLASEVVNRAELSGYLRAVPMRGKPSPSTIGRTARKINGFRLHRRFAPKFGFSYRGAYEPVSISADYIATLCAPGSEVMPDEWLVSALQSSSSGFPEQLNLTLAIGPDDAE